MEHSVILFDGVCNLCNQSVLFVIKRDSDDRFRFSPLQGDYALSHLSASSDLNKRPDSVILIENGKVYSESTAALRIARKLSGLWPLLYGFIIVPKFIRNYVYRWIADRRYRIWGKTDSCMVPTAKLKDKFI